MFSLLLQVKLCISTYCNAKSVGILGLRVFKHILSIFTLKHEKPCKMAVFIAFICKTVYIYVLQCQQHRNLGNKSLQANTQYFHLKTRKTIAIRLFSLLFYVKLCISKYCNAKGVGIWGLSVFKQILSISTLKHEKPCKMAIFIAFICKLVYI